jgi:hypothetical protein
MTPRITHLGPAVPVQAHVTVPPPASSPGITPPGIAIPVEADMFAYSPTWDRASGPRIHHAFASTCFLHGRAHVLVYLVHNFPFT